MKNKMTDLNDHLFAQLERLSDEDLSGDELETELDRAKGVCSVADKIINNASTCLQAAKLASDHGVKPNLPMLGVDSEG